MEEYIIIGGERPKFPIKMIEIFRWIREIERNIAVSEWSYEITPDLHKREIEIKIITEQRTWSKRFKLTESDLKYLIERGLIESYLSWESVIEAEKTETELDEDDEFFI